MYTFMPTKLRSISLYRYFKVALHTVSEISSRKGDSLNVSHNSVIVSQSHDIYENLAFEDWLYKNYDLASKDISILLMWYNGPSVVIGRHQNPWIECSVDFCESNGIDIARRNSGGGTVYHDFGNLNFSFLTPLKNYNRKRNLEFICESICRRWPINLSVTQRDDIICNDQYKDGVESKATSSTRAKVINLNTVCSDIDTMNVMRAVTDYYKQIYDIENKNVLCINPNEAICSGMNNIKEELRSWKWRFGRTPDFVISRSFPVSLGAQFHKSNISCVEIQLKVKKGLIENICLNPHILEDDNFDALNHFIIGFPFSKVVNVPLDKWIEVCEDKITCNFIKNCILQMIIHVFR